jgi:hypothetical protein
MLIVLHYIGNLRFNKKLIIIIQQFDNLWKLYYFSIKIIGNDLICMIVYNIQKKIFNNSNVDFWLSIIYSMILMWAIADYEVKRRKESKLEANKN